MGNIRVVEFYKVVDELGECDYECKDPNNPSELKICGEKTNILIVNKGGAKRKWLCEKHFKYVRRQVKMREYGK